MKNISSKNLKKKGGKAEDLSIQLFRAIETQPDGVNLVQKIEELIKDGATLRYKNNDNQTILIYAFIKNKPSVVGYMLQQIAEYPEYRDLIDARDKFGNTFHDYQTGNTGNIENTNTTHRSIQELQRQEYNYENRLRRQLGSRPLFAEAYARQQAQQAQEAREAHPQDGGGYKIYNNRKYKIYTGKRGGKYICVGVEKKKVYI